MKRIIFLLTILSIFFIAGCVSGGGKVSGTSLNILKFEPELKLVTEGDEVFVHMQIQNNGAFDAKNTMVNLYLHGGFQEVYETYNDEWEQSVGSGGKLRAPNTKLGTAGQTDEITWQLKAPDIGPGVKTKKFDLKADVYYDYEATTWKKFPILEYTRIQRLRAEKKSLPTSETGYVQAPIKIEINVQEPVIYNPNDDSENANTAEIKVLLKKVGDGFIKTEKGFTDADCSTDLNCVDAVILKIPDGLEFTDDCDFGEEQSEGLVELNFRSKQASFVNLIDGTNAQLDCKIKIPIPEPGESSYMGSAQEMYPLIRAEAYYTHHIRGATEIEVMKVVGR